MKKAIACLFGVILIIMLFVTAFAEEDNIFSYDPETGRISGEVNAVGNVEIWVDGALSGGSRLSIEADDGVHVVDVFVDGVQILSEKVYVNVEEGYEEPENAPETANSTIEKKENSPKPLEADTSGNVPSQKNITPIIITSAIVLVLIIIIIIMVIPKKGSGKHS